MINLKELIGDKYRVTMTEEYRHGGDKPDLTYMAVVGRRGDIMAWDDDLLEVTVYGVALAIKPGVLPDRTHNLALPIKCERLGWKSKNHYDDSTSFLLPSARIHEAIRVIKGRKRRRLSPEARKMAVERLARMRSGKD